MQAETALPDLESLGAIEVTFGGIRDEAAS